MTESRVFSYKKAKTDNVLTEAEFRRFTIAAMACSGSFKVDFEACALEEDSTAGSFQVMYNKAIRKLKTANCYIDANGDTCALSPIAPKKGAGRKRKNAEDGDGGTLKKGRKTKQNKSVEVYEDEDNMLDEKPIIKDEDSNDEIETPV